MAPSCSTLTPANNCCPGIAMYMAQSVMASCSLLEPHQDQAWDKWLGALRDAWTAVRQLAPG